MIKPRNKIFFHITICVFSWLLIIQPLIDFMQGFGPLSKAISEISMTDVYFSTSNPKLSDDIYIVDVGELPDKKVRQYLYNFLKEINIKHKPRAIGLDLYFDNRFKDPVYDSILQIEISHENIVRACRIKALDHIEYIDHSEFEDIRYDYGNSDGYTNSLQEDPTKHPCIRSYLPQKLIKDTLYSDFSVLVSKKANPNNYYQYLNNINPLSKKVINYNVSFKNNIIDITDTLRYNELRDKIVLIGICTYDNRGIPKFTDDTWFTPLNELYIGRSQKDMYGVEIKATIISNIINGEHIDYSAKRSRIINLIISLIIYFILLTLYINIRESFVFIKVFSQTIGALSLAILNIIVMYSTGLYLDLTFSIGVIFLAPEIVEFIEEISEKYNLPEVTNKVRSYISSILHS